MKTTAEIIEILRDYKARSAEKYGIETLGLFGSVARGEQNEKSDIDVFIKLRKTSYYTLMDIKDDLEQVFRQTNNRINTSRLPQRFTYFTFRIASKQNTMR